MAKWSTVRTSVGRAASKAIHKTGEVVDTTSLYVKLKTAEAKLDGYYTALGRLTFKQLECGESQAEQIAPVIEHIRATNEKIRKIRNDIEIDKAKRKTKTEIIIQTSVEQMNQANKDEEEA